MTILETTEYFSNLYGRRNRVFLPGLRERIDHLTLGICDLHDVVRKDRVPQAIGSALARVAARIFCIAEHFWEVPLSKIMCQKYPAGSCSWCQCFPCKCPEARPEAVLGVATKEQIVWSLRQWQQYLGSLYGDKNKARGIDNILGRLFKEAGELLCLQMTIPALNIAPDKVEIEFAMELADALAWTIAVANFFDIDLETQIAERYGNCCWKCNDNPCACTSFGVQPMEA